MPTTTQKQKDQDQQEAIQYLQSIIKPHQTVYTTVKHVSASGMSRQVNVYIATLDINHQPAIMNITWYVAKALQQRFNDKNNTITVQGCGMDMGYHLVHTLAHYLHKDNQKAINTSHNNDVGYSLNQQWI